MQIIRQNINFIVIFTISITLKIIIFSNLDLDLDHDFSVYVPALAVSGGAIPVKDVITLYGPIHTSINALWLHFFGFGVFSLRIFHVVLIIICLIILRTILLKFYSQKHVDIAIIGLILLFPVEINASRVAGPYPLITIIILVFVYLINMESKRFKFFYAGFVLGLLLFLRPHVFTASTLLLIALIPFVYKEKNNILKVLLGVLISVLTGIFVLYKIEALRPWYEYNIVSTFDFFGGGNSTQNVQDLGDRIGIGINVVPIAIYFYFIFMMYIASRNKKNTSLILNRNFLKFLLPSIIVIQIMMSYFLHRSVQYSSYALFPIIIIVIGIFAFKLSEGLFLKKMIFEKQLSLIVGSSLLVQIFPYYDPLHIYWSIIVIFGFTVPFIIQNIKSGNNLTHISLLIFVILNIYSIYSSFNQSRAIISDLEVSRNLKSSTSVNSQVRYAQQAVESALFFNHLLVFQCPIALPSGVLNLYNSVDRHHVSNGKFIQNTKFAYERIDLLQRADYPIIRCTNLNDMIPGRFPLSYMSPEYDERYIRVNSFGESSGVIFEVFIPTGKN